MRRTIGVIAQLEPDRIPRIPRTTCAVGGLKLQSELVTYCGESWSSEADPAAGYRIRSWTCGVDDDGRDDHGVSVGRHRCRRNSSRAGGTCTGPFRGPCLSAGMAPVASRHSKGPAPAEDLSVYTIQYTI